MRLLEIDQISHICASIRLDEATAVQGQSVRRFHPRIRRRCRGQGAQLCLHKGPRLPGLPEDGTRQARCSGFGCPQRSEQWRGGAARKEACSWGGVHAFCENGGGMMQHSISWWCTNGASHRKKFDTPRLRGSCRCTTVHLGRFQRRRNFKCAWVHLLNARATWRILKAKPDAIPDGDHSRNRVFPVTEKLTKEERVRVTDFARSQGLARQEWMRDVILRYMNRVSASDPSLAEILGVRLLLVNVSPALAAGQKLAPERFDKLLDEVSDARHQLAGKLATSAGRK